MLAGDSRLGMDQLEDLNHLVELDDLEAQYSLEESLQDRNPGAAQDTSRSTRYYPPSSSSVVPNLGSAPPSRGRQRSQGGRTSVSALRL